MKTKKIMLDLLFLIFAMAACSDSSGDPTPDPTPDPKKPYITVDPVKIDAERLGGSFKVTVDTNIEDITVTSPVTWCTTKYEKGILTLNVSSNTNSTLRTTSISIKGDTQNKFVTITQKGLSSYDGDLKDDIKLAVSSAKASSFQSGSDIEKSIDGNYSTSYHSAWANSATNYFPITLTYSFKDVASMDYLVYYPRQDGGSNGHIKEVELWVATKENPTLQKYGDYDFMGVSSASRINFTDALINPIEVQFIVKSGTGDGQGFVACAEMEFYQNNPDNFDFLKIFTDNTCSEVKSGLTETDISKVTNAYFRDLALDILRGNYESEFRVQTYTAMPNPSIMAADNKISTYGMRDNPTGIYATSGEELIVFVGNTNASLVPSIFIQDPDNKIAGISYSLKTGLNKIKATNSGLIYVMYYSKKGTENPIKINIASGTVNGYFDNSKHTSEDWTRLLAKATFRHFDVKGKHVVMTFETEAFRKYTKDGLELIDLYDKIVYLEQEFMGLYKYNRETRNRLYMLAVTGDSHMFATSYYTGYNINTQAQILDASLVRTKDMWGPAHEIGHVHQTRPGLKWIGMTEVTNNIHSLLVQTSFGATSRLITDGVYSKAKSEIVDAKTAHNAGTNVWNKLVPFWQLKLYLENAQGISDFYKDIYETIRVNADPTTDGECQLQFIKIACHAANLDLTDFFTAWGFLTPVDISIDDYGTKKFTITQTQIDLVKSEIKAKNYPKPKHNNIYEITDLNVSSFK